MEIRPEELRIDIIRRVGDGGCAVRITHVPTGATAYADDGETIAENREVALARLRQAMDDEQ